MTPEGKFFCSITAIVLCAIMAMLAMTFAYQYYSDAQDYELNREMAKPGYSQVAEVVNGYTRMLWKPVRAKGEVK